jgi:hypothetical protein
VGIQELKRLLARSKAMVVHIRGPSQLRHELASAEPVVRARDTWPSASAGTIRYVRDGHMQGEVVLPGQDAGASGD